MPPFRVLAIATLCGLCNNIVFSINTCRNKYRKADEIPLFYAIWMCNGWVDKRNGQKCTKKHVFCTEYLYN